MCTLSWMQVWGQQRSNQKDDSDSRWTRKGSRSEVEGKVKWWNKWPEQEELSTCNSLGKVNRGGRHMHRKQSGPGKWTDRKREMKSEPWTTRIAARTEKEQLHSKKMVCVGIGLMWEEEALGLKMDSQLLKIRRDNPHQMNLKISPKNLRPF